MRIFYDYEFLENGRTISGLSVGMVAENGDELYRIFEDAAAITNAIGHPWLRENVIPHLPVKVPPKNVHAWDWDEGHPDWDKVEDPDTIAEQVHDFILAHSDRDPADGREAVELWAWCAAYDHVALAQMWGPMVDLPKGIPMYTNDLRQLVRQLGNPEIPSRPDSDKRAHNALTDAWDNAARFEWLMDLFDDRDMTGDKAARPGARMAF
jgi:hypothetical protein